jgi:hypothetical protein
MESKGERLQAKGIGQQDEAERGRDGDAATKL